MSLVLIRSQICRNFLALFPLSLLPCRASWACKVLENQWQFVADEIEYTFVAQSSSFNFDTINSLKVQLELQNLTLLLLIYEWLEANLFRSELQVDLWIFFYQCQLLFQAYSDWGVCLLGWDSFGLSEWRLINGGDGNLKSGRIVEWAPDAILQIMIRQCTKDLQMDCCEFDVWLPPSWKYNMGANCLKQVGSVKLSITNNHYKVNARTFLG